MRCGLPSSSTRKSFATRLETNLPLLSVTVTGTMTSVVVLVKVGWPCAGAPAGPEFVGWDWGAVCAAGAGWACCGSAFQDKSSVQAEAAANRKSRDMASCYYDNPGTREEGLGIEGTALFGVRVYLQRCGAAVPFTVWLRPIPNPQPPIPYSRISP